MMKPERHIWEEDSTHRAVAGKEYDEVWDYAEQLESENEALKKKAYHEDDEGRGYAYKDRCAQLEVDLENTSKAYDKVLLLLGNEKAENEAWFELCRVFVGGGDKHILKMRNTYLLTEEKPETPISDVPITP